MTVLTVWNLRQRQYRPDLCHCRKLRRPGRDYPRHEKLAADCAAGKQDPEEITEQVVASYLDTAGMPDPDLLIRTSGEIRLSNYLLWQLAYTEIYVTDCLWPDFDQEELEKAIMAYNRRDRRYGGVKQA